jgi:hypothetical protein
MRKVVVLALGLSMMLAVAAQAQVTLNSVRIGAMDTATLAKFYQAAFGMLEINRLAAGGNTGIVIDIAVDPVGNRLELIQRRSEPGRRV